MARNFAQIKQQARHDLHNQMAVPAVLTTRAGVVTNITARLHQNPFMQGDIDYQGYTEREESYIRVVLSQVYAVATGDTLFFPDYNQTLVLFQRRPRNDTVYETWIVKEVLTP